MVSIVSHKYSYHIQQTFQIGANPYKEDTNIIPWWSSFRLPLLRGFGVTALAAALRLLVASTAWLRLLSYLTSVFAKVN